jgi:hypothetical protein
LDASDELGAVGLSSEPQPMLVVRRTAESTDLTVAEAVDILIVLLRK